MGHHLLMLDRINSETSHLHRVMLGFTDRDHVNAERSISGTNNDLRQFIHDAIRNDRFNACFDYYMYVGHHMPPFAE